MNYYPHHIGDYRRDTTHLSLLEHGIYRQLIDQYCLSESPLPSDMEKLMRSVCVRNADEVRSLESVLADFFTLEEAGYMHKRCEKTLAEYKDKSKKAADSANARWNKAEDANALNKDANAIRTQCDGNANQEPRTINHKPLKSKALAPATRLPHDWQLSQEDFDFAIAHDARNDPNRIADQFRDYWIAKSGKDATKADWSATWRNWVRRQTSTPSKQNYESAADKTRKTIEGLTGRASNEQRDFIDIN